MKKNISINISGIIFHIEEDGYETLKNYLDSISRYFSSFDDSQEIVSDIENRIAEIFLSKLKDGKQVITAEDIQSLMATMGSIRDFEAIEEDHPSEEKAEDTHQEAEAAAEPVVDEEETPRRLYRDKGKRVFGGIASGLGRYFTIDPTWIRLLFILTLFSGTIIKWVGLGDWGNFRISLGGLGLLTYIILWIVVPGKYFVKEPKKVKKLYRNPGNRVLGGVSGGLASFFGVDPTVIRLIFILLIIPGGFGIILYIILWVILPEAKTITEKMQMQGEPVTLSNIEHSVKKSLNVKPESEESFGLKLLLFPFRLISSVISGLGRALGPIMSFLVEGIRIIAALFLMMVGLSLIVSIVVGLGIFIGVWSNWGGDYTFWGTFPFELVRESISAWPVVALSVVLFIPALGLVLVGLALLLKKSITNKFVGWTLFGLWILGLLMLFISLPQTIAKFGTEGEYRETETFYFDKGTAVLGLSEVGYSNFDGVSLELRGHDDSTFRLVKRYVARGSSRLDASDNARLVNYNVALKSDSILTFDSNLQFGSEGKFRFQELSMTLYVPYNQPFYMKEDLKAILRNTLIRRGYRVSQMENNLWEFNELGINCITCK
jgi:phage shock protein PspC (stress-responsive transcriptional regulator)